MAWVKRLDFLLWLNVFVTLVTFISLSLPTPLLLVPLTLSSSELWLLERLEFVLDGMWARS